MKNALILKTWLGLVLGWSLTTSAQTWTIFYDDFENGIGAWSLAGGTTLDWANPTNRVPDGGQHSALLNISTDRMYHNLGRELIGSSTATWWIYDRGGSATTTNRAYGEIRCFTGSGYGSGTLETVYAIGIYNSSTLPGEPINYTKYQGRIQWVTNGTIYWFNLNGPDSPNRSVGWHKFDIQRVVTATATNYNFYVDDMLSRSFGTPGTPVADRSWDSILMGSVAAGSTLGDAWFDGISVTVPQLQFICSNIIVEATGPGGATVNFQPTVVGGCAPISISCTPPSGSTCPVGDTPVICDGFDSCNEVANCGFTITVQPKPAPAYFFKATVLPPPDGVYVTPGLSHAAFANGVVLRNVRHRVFTQSVTPPPIGEGLVHSFACRAEMDISLDGGITWAQATAPAGVGVSIRHTQDNGGTEFYDTEMLSLDLSGGLPAGILIRESPILSSTGGTTVRPMEVGYMISSFFDIFLEISTDGGLTWEPAAEAAHVELRSDPALVTEVTVPTRLLPLPLEQYISPGDHHIQTASGIVIKDVKQKTFTHSVLPPAVGAPPLVHYWDSQFYFQLSVNGGLNWQWVRAPASVNAQIQRLGSGEEELYETEITALAIGGGDLPPTIRIRESPTLPSRGMTLIKGDAGGGSNVVQSFFDIFLEVSIDGGGTWAAPTNGPARAQAESIGPASTFLSNVLPPIEGEYISSEQWYASYAQGVIISNVIHKRFTQAIPPPPPGESYIHTFDSQVDMMVFIQDSGWSQTTAPAQCRMRITSSQDQDTTRYFDTEMLQLSIAGGGLPNGILIRESPIKASMGRTSQSSLPTGGVMISSFFDVFTELSTDGGQTWAPSQTGPVPVILRPQPFQPPAIIDEPDDATNACSSDATFCVRATGTSPLGYQWSSNGIAIPEGTNNCLVVSNVTLAQNGNIYQVVVVNAYGNATSRPATLTVLDTTPPVITCPQDISVSTDSNRCEAYVQYALPVAVDACGTVTNVTCAPPSGAIFPLGSTTVLCSAYDQSGNRSNCRFGVVVVDGEAPVITCPADLSVTAYAPTGAAVNYPAPTVSDNCGVVLTNCVPAPGNVFPLGTTAVNCTTRDTSGNESSCSFSVTVRLIGLETDRFDHSVARIAVSVGGEPAEELTLAGPTEMQVVIGPKGECIDLDGDGLDQALATMTRLDLTGFASPLGNIQLRLRPGTTSSGEVAERCNNNPGVLDLPPFILVPPSPCQADSFFDVFVEVGMDRPLPRTYHSDGPVRMVAQLTHKPPAANEVYTNTAPVRLLDELGQPTELVLTRVSHVPNPKEVDEFPNSEAFVTVRTPTGTEPVTLFMRGPTTIEVAIPPAGWAADTDGNQREQAVMQMTQLSLAGKDPLENPVSLRLATNPATIGSMEELANQTLGILDIAPFVLRPGLPGAESFFDVSFELNLMDQLPLHPAQPVRMVSVLKNKPPLPGETFTNGLQQGPIQLLLPSGQPSGYELIGVLHTPVPLPCPQITIARLVPGPKGEELEICWRDDGRDCRLQYALSLGEQPIAWHDVTIPPAQALPGYKCYRIEPSGDMKYFRLCAACPAAP